MMLQEVGFTEATKNETFGIKRIRMFMLYLYSFRKRRPEKTATTAIKRELNIRINTTDNGRLFE
jgi:hypothetical protein